MKLQKTKAIQYFLYGFGLNNRDVKLRLVT